MKLERDLTTTENLMAQAVETYPYGEDNKYSYAIYDDGYNIYLNGNPWITQHE